MIYESKVLKIVPEELQPPEYIKCRGCVNAQWRLFRNDFKMDSSKKRHVDCYCHKTFQVIHSATEGISGPEECDSFNDEIKDPNE